MKEYLRQLDHIRSDLETGATSIPAVITEMKLRGYTILDKTEAQWGRDNVALLERKFCSKAGTCTMKGKD